MPPDHYHILILLLLLLLLLLLYTTTTVTSIIPTPWLADEAGPAGGRGEGQGEPELPNDVRKVAVP